MHHTAGAWCTPDRKLIEFPPMISCKRLTLCGMTMQSWLLVTHLQTELCCLVLNSLVLSVLVLHLRLGRW